MTLRLTNTLSGEAELFEPLEPGHVRMYTCGPTVYERAHIGNFRTFAWEDLLRRYLRWRGYRVTQVMNLTDVDDRTIRAARERGVTLEQVTAPVIEMFFEDWATLGLEPVEHNPRATRHIPQMIELVGVLLEKRHAYRAEGSIYFAIDTFPGYGRLIRLEAERLRPTGRVSGDEEYSKEDPRDFVLWKGGDREEEGEVAVWDSPWGPGRPGWHLECSAMAMQYLGPTLDIHTGGVDNIFPHHVNEMAQSEAATGRPFARFWLHAAHLLVDGEKMSKSLGNFYTLPDLLARGYRPSAIRWLLLSGHYRSQLNFTLEGLRQAERALDRLEEFRARLEPAAGGLPDPGPTEEDRGGPDAPGAGVSGASPGETAAALRGAAERGRRELEAALDDDLNVSEAIAAVFRLVRDVNGLLDAAGRAPPPEAARAVLETVADFDRIFGVLALRERERAEIPPGLRAWIEARIEERREARSRRDFARADAIRDEALARGFVLEDTPAGTRWKWSGSAAPTADRPAGTAGR